MSAVRFAMFAERAMPRLQQAWAVNDEPVGGLDAKRLRDLITAKNEADKVIAELAPMLFPEDE